MWLDDPVDGGPATAKLHAMGAAAGPGLVAALSRAGAPLASVLRLLALVDPHAGTTEVTRLAATHADPDVRRAALELMFRRGQTTASDLPALRRAARSENPEIRRLTWMLAATLAPGDPASVRAIADLVRAAGWPEGVGLQRRLEQMQLSYRTVPALLACLRDASLAHMRDMARAHLRRLGTRTRPAPADVAELAAVLAAASRSGDVEGARLLLAMLAAAGDLSPCWPEQVAIIAQLTEHDDPELRDQATRTLIAGGERTWPYLWLPLGRVGPEVTLELLGHIDRLGDKLPLDRTQLPQLVGLAVVHPASDTARLAGKLASPRGVEWLPRATLTALLDGDVPVARRWARSRLASRGAKDPVPALLRTASAPGASAAGVAATRRLVRMRDPRLIPLIPGLLRSLDARERAAGMRRLRRLGGPAIPTLLQQADQAVPGGADALRAVHASQRSAYAEAYVRALNSPVAEVRAHAVRVLEACDERAWPRVTRMCRRLVRGPLRGAADRSLHAALLFALSPRDRPGLLQRLLANTQRGLDPAVPTLSAWALRHGGEAAIPTLTGLLEHEDSQRVAAAISALAALGPVARPARAAIERVAAARREAGVQAAIGFARLRIPPTPPTVEPLAVLIAGVRADAQPLLCLELARTLGPPALQALVGLGANGRELLIRLGARAVPTVLAAPWAPEVVFGTLGSLGPAAWSAIPRLERAVADPTLTEEARAEAAAALVSIRAD